MTLFILLLQPFQIFNDLVGRIGRFLSVIALAMMVFVILLQVFCRYVLNDALPWPDEAARFFMLWLTGLMAPIALRQSGFVAIDTLHRYFSIHLVSAIALLLLLLSLIVLLVAFQLGWKHVGSGSMFSSATLRIPLYLVGLKTIKMSLFYMYLSLFTGVILMIFVNIEMILRQLLQILDKNIVLRPIPNLEIERID